MCKNVKFLFCLLFCHSVRSGYRQGRSEQHVHQSEPGMHQLCIQFNQRQTCPKKYMKSLSPNSNRKTTKMCQKEAAKVFHSFGEEAVDDCFFVSLTRQRKGVWPPTLLAECLKSRPRITSSKIQFYLFQHHQDNKPRRA